MLTKQQKQSIWEKWTRQTIYADRGVYNIAPRHLVMKDFVLRGLIPFVRAKGYVFREKPALVYNSFLRLLFAYSLREKVIFKNNNKGYNREHFDEFEHRFDTMEMEPFWEQWGFIQDFEDGSYGEKVKYVLPYFIWASIQLENSSAYIQLENLFDELNEIEASQRLKETKAKDDPYLQDSSKVSYDDRHWH